MHMCAALALAVENHCSVGNTQRFTLGSWKANKGVLSTEDALQGIHLVQ